MNNWDSWRPRLQRGTIVSAFSSSEEKRSSSSADRNGYSHMWTPAPTRKDLASYFLLSSLICSNFFLRAGWKAVSACSGTVLSRTYLTKTGGCHSMLPLQSLMWGMCPTPTAFAGLISQVASNPRRAQSRNSSCDSKWDLCLCLVVTVKGLERRKNILQDPCTRARWPGEVRSLF